MKKTLLFFVILSGFLQAQEKAIMASGKTVILNNDFTWRYEGGESLTLKADNFKTENGKTVAGLINDLKIDVENGEGKNIPVKFTFLADEDYYNKLSIEKVNKMIRLSRIRLMSGLKNEYSFIPRKIDISFSDKHQKWVIIWEYTAKNSYGGDMQGSKVLLYDDQINEVGI